MSDLSLIETVDEILISMRRQFVMIVMGQQAHDALLCAMITPMEPVTRQPGARVLGPPQPVRIQGEGRDTGMPSNGVFGASTPGWTTSYFAPHQQGVMSAAEFD